MELGTNDGINFVIENGIGMGSDDSNKLGIKKGIFCIFAIISILSCPIFPYMHMSTNPVGLLWLCTYLLKVEETVEFGTSTGIAFHIFS
jgi:hypothetical protein